MQEENELQGVAEEREQELRKLSQTPDLYHKLAMALAPSVWEMDDIKKGILLQLFGATHKQLDPEATVCVPHQTSFAPTSPPPPFCGVLSLRSSGAHRVAARASVARSTVSWSETLVRPNRSFCSTYTRWPLAVSIRLGKAPRPLVSPLTSRAIQKLANSF